MQNQKIDPFLWFNEEAVGAAEFYTALFSQSRIQHVAHYGKAGANISGRREGSVMTVAFELAGQTFIGLNGGPLFHFTPAVSFFINCETREEIDRLWAALSNGGKVLMELGQYPFSERFGFVADRFGVSWQLILVAEQPKQKIVPAFLFNGKQFGRAEEAMKWYTSLFEKSQIVAINRYGKGEPQPEGAVAHGIFELAGQRFVTTESSLDHGFTFSLANSFVINCEDQREVDHFWNKLISDGGNPSQCGWLEDKFGVSWQVVPRRMAELMSQTDPARAERVMTAMLKMTKLDIKTLEQA